MSLPDFTRETDLIARGFARVAGIDEVGRGPIAGPVTAGAVVLDPDRIPPGLDDSKKLSAKRRQTLSDLLWDTAEVAIGEASVEEIDAMGIVPATFLAMRRAVDGLNPPPDFALVDGTKAPNLPFGAQPLVKGDTLSQSIAAASIVAKIWRDLGMVALAQQHPGYGWETNMGYGSKSHIAGLENLGVTPHHRRSVRRIHNILYQQN